MSSIVHAPHGAPEIERDEFERALALSLGISNLERARPEMSKSSETMGDSDLIDAALSEAIKASIRDAQADDSATQRAIELAMKESLKYVDGPPAHPDLDLGGVSVQGSCMELAIDLASAPIDGDGTFPPQSSAAANATSPPPHLHLACEIEEAGISAGPTSESFLARRSSVHPTWDGTAALPGSVVPPARPFHYDEDFDRGGAHAPSSVSASEPSRGWVCVCAPDEMAHFFARQAFLVPAGLRAMVGMAHAGEPLFLMSRFDGLLRGGFEVKPGPQQRHENGSVSVPFRVAREALVKYAVPLGGSGLLEVLGELSSQSCWKLELWQVDAIEGRLAEEAAQAHAGEQPGQTDRHDETVFRSLSAGDEDESGAAYRSLSGANTARDSEIARELHAEMEREDAVRRAGLAAEEQRKAAAQREAEEQAQEEEAARIEEEAERLRRKQEDADARRARELQELEQAQLEYEANERKQQELQDAQQAHALHIAMASDNVCVPCAPSIAVPPPKVVSAPPADTAGPSRAAAGSKLVVIDAMNVGRSYNLGFVCPEHHNYRFDDRQRNSKNVPVCATAISIAIEHFLKKGYRVEAFLPEWAYYGGKSKNMFAHEHTLLRRFINPHGKQRSIFPVPSGADDDLWILNRAIELIDQGEDVLVLSNDMYRDHIASGRIDDAWMKKHAVKFSWLPMNGFMAVL